MNKWITILITISITLNLLFVINYLNKPDITSTYYTFDSKDTIYIYEKSKLIEKNNIKIKQLKNNVKENKLELIKKDSLYSDSSSINTIIQGWQSIK
jgi:hypothetical protein